MGVRLKNKMKGNCNTCLFNDTLKKNKNQTRHQLGMQQWLCSESNIFNQVSEVANTFHHCKVTIIVSQLVVHVKVIIRAFHTTSDKVSSSTQNYCLHIQIILLITKSHGIGSNEESSLCKRLNEEGCSECQFSTANSGEEIQSCITDNPINLIKWLRIDWIASK